jgi:tetratricopeptide (TPR) repeat protein
VDLLPLDERRAGYRELCVELDPARQPGWAVFWLVRRGRYTDVDDATLFATLRRAAEFHYGDYLVIAQWSTLAYARKKPNFVLEILLSSPAALALRPNDPFVLFLHGYGLTLAGRPADALPFLRRSLALRPEFAKARTFAAVCLFALGKPTDAASQLRPVFDDPKEARQAAQWVAEAAQFGAAFDFDAVADAAGLSSDDPAMKYQFLARLGESLLAAKRPAEAELFLRRAVGFVAVVSNKPGEARAKLFARLAACRLAVGDTPVTLAHLRSAYDADPRSWRTSVGVFWSSLPSLPAGWREFVAATDQLFSDREDQKQFDTLLDNYLAGHAGPEGRLVARARAARAAAEPDGPPEVAPPPRPAK